MTEISCYLEGHVISPTSGRKERASKFEWRVVDIPTHLSRNEARVLLTEHAEYGQWELARSVIYHGGARRVWLRRRTMRLQRTDAA